MVHLAVCAIAYLAGEFLDEAAMFIDIRVRTAVGAALLFSGDGSAGTPGSHVFGVTFRAVFLTGTGD